MAIYGRQISKANIVLVGCTHFFSPLMRTSVLSEKLNASKMIIHWVMGGAIGSLSPLTRTISRNMGTRKRYYDYYDITVFLLTCLKPNMCDSELRAVDHANTRFSKGYQATGVGGVICARHSLVRKNGLGDLQKGERCVLFSSFELTGVHIFLDMLIWTSVSWQPWLVY
jgi:hypothetical protein